MSTAPPLASEQTAIGEQTLVHGVAPITPRDRLALRANAPRKAQWTCNGLVPVTYLITPPWLRTPAG
jgi:hypothetical protein